jgi:hypothetical protein
VQDILDHHAYWLQEFAAETALDKIHFDTSTDARRLVQYDFTTDLNDSSPNAYHLTPVGGAGIVTGQLTNPAEGVLSLNGSSQHCYNTSLSWPWYEPFTIAAWAYSDVMENNDTICNCNPSETGWGKLAARNTDQIGFTHTCYRPSAGNTSTPSAYTNTAATAGQWHHVVGVMDTHLCYMRMYRNGVLEGTYYLRDDNSHYNTYHNLGFSEIIIGARWRTNPGWRWDGYVSRFKIYEGALSASSALSLYNAEKSNYPGH